MRPLLYFFFSAFFFLQACSDESSASSENDIDAARNFIRAGLDGDYEKAKSYMVQDSLNLEYLDNWRNLKERMSPEEKQSYKEASINIHSVNELNDSVSVVNYSNSYKKKADSLKVIRQNEEWLIDFKYSFQARDTTP